MKRIQSNHGKTVDANLIKKDTRSNLKVDEENKTTIKELKI